MESEELRQPSVRFVWAALVPAAVASVLGLVVLVLSWGHLAPWLSALLLLAIALTVGSAVFFRFRLAGEHVALETEQKEISQERDALESLRGSLEKETLGFEKRRKQFEDRLMTYHEWMEFPDHQAIAEAREEASETVSAKDQEALQRIQEASDRIFDGFQSDRYSDQGKFDPRLLGNDIIDFVGDIAAVYQPDAKEPLLETSVEKLLKAVNHISLQLLFQLEQLPFNLKEYSLAKAYEHTRTASKFYH
ncbi:MAG: hypothetical protein AAF191_12760, partial [Verrucomicrobiota bacterium]